MRRAEGRAGGAEIGGAPRPVGGGEAPPGYPEIEEQERIIGGVRTFSRHLGAPGAPREEIVAIHGVGVSSTYWLPAARALAASGPFRIHLPDLPGFGRSANPPWPPELPRLAAHLRDWIAEAVPGPCHLVGQSMGCELAVLLAAQEPERVRRVVLAAPCGLPKLRSLTLQLLAAALDAPREPLALYAAILPDYLRCGLLRIARMLREQKSGLAGRLLREVRCPVLVLRGAADPVASAARAAATARALPRARLAVVPGAHGAHFSHAAEFAAAVAAFLLEPDAALSLGGGKGAAPPTANPSQGGLAPPPEPLRCASPGTDTPLSSWKPIPCGSSSIPTARPTSAATSRSPSPPMSSS